MRVEQITGTLSRDGDGPQVEVDLELTITEHIGVGEEVKRARLLTPGFADGNYELQYNYFEPVRKMLRLRDGHLMEMVAL
jgi:hypothetical protein